MINRNLNKGVIILSGGNSSRMNYPKPYLFFDTRVFLEKIIDEYLNAGIENIVVVMNEEFCKEKWTPFLLPIRSKAKIIENNNPTLGRIYSLQLGLEKMKDIGFCFILNIDNPFVTKEIISDLWKNRNANGFTLPVCDGKGGHPILVSQKIIRHILSEVNYGLTLKELLMPWDRKEIKTEDKRILININTREDYQNYFQQKKSLPLC